MDLETNRLLLTENYSVVDEHVAWLNDKELMRWSEQQFKSHDITTQADFLWWAKNNGTPLVFDIRLKPKPLDVSVDGTPVPWPTIGSLHVHIDERHKRADLGIMIGPQYHRKGYGAEAWKVVQGWLFAARGMAKLEAGTVENNLAMVKILIGLGWMVEGGRDLHFRYGGKPQRLLLFGRSVVNHLNDRVAP